MFLRERLKALRDGWQELHQMWENRQQLLSQSLNLQMFNRDARQAEVILSQQEHVLAKDETPVSESVTFTWIYPRNMSSFKQKCLAKIFISKA